MFAFARIGRAHFDPGIEIGDFGGGELFVGRHLQIFVAIANGLHEQTFGGIAGDDGGAGLASFKERGAGVERQPAFGFFRFGAVTLVTFINEQWSYLRFEEFGLMRIQRRRFRGERAGRKRDDDEADGWHKLLHFCFAAQASH